MSLEDTRQIVGEYLYRLERHDFRIFFSGHKGFHIEVLPKARGIVPLDNQWRQFEDIHVKINKDFRAGFVDPIKDYIRLHNSINTWIANNGTEINRNKFELSLCELNSIGIDEICKRAESFATNSLC